jgi:prevent-host-death family protein
VAVTSSEARRRLLPLIDEVNGDQVVVEIVSTRHSPEVVPARDPQPADVPEQLALL